jgi:peptidoglycan/LPS O-acetylase OafA/YrhL
MKQLIATYITPKLGTIRYSYSDLAGKRIFGLDLVRSLSVCAVVIAHSGYEYIYGFRYGVIAIEYFFVMSGFLVGEMLIREFHEGGDHKTLVNFWIKRWFRTLPLYYLILILKVILTRPPVGPEVWPYFFFLQNNVGGIGFYAVSWTLVIEEWFYLFMPLLVYLFFRGGIVRRHFLLLSVFVIVAENVIRYLYVTYRDVPWGGVVGNFPFRFDSFMIGVLIAFVKTDYRRVFDFLAKWYVFAAISFCFLVYLFFFARSGGGTLVNKTLWTSTVAFSITSIFMALQMPFVNNSVYLNSISDRNLLKKGLTWLSLLSYPIYLIHMDFLHYVNTGMPVMDQAINYAIIVILSYGLIVFFHQPVTSMRSRFLIK